MLKDCIVYIKAAKIDYQFMINLFKFIFLKTETKENVNKILNNFNNIVIHNNFDVFLTYKNKWSIIRLYAFKIPNNIIRIKKKELIGFCLNHTFYLDKERFKFNLTEEILI